MAKTYIPTGLEVDSLPVSLVPDTESTEERYTVHLGTGRIGSIWRCGKGAWHHSVRLITLTNEQIEVALSGAN